MPPCGSLGAPVGVVGSSFGLHTVVLTGDSAGRLARLPSAAGGRGLSPRPPPPPSSDAVPAATAPLRYSSNDRPSMLDGDLLMAPECARAPASAGIAIPFADEPCSTLAVSFPFSPGLGPPPGVAGSVLGLSPSGLPCSCSATSVGGRGFATPIASSPCSCTGSRETNSF